MVDPARILAPSRFDVELAAERAAFAELVHQRACRARAADLPCVACLQYEADWLAADLALAGYQEGTP